MSVSHQELSSWRVQVTEQSNRLARLRNRKRDVEHVKRELGSAIASNMSSINNCLRACSDFSSAIDYPAGNASLRFILLGKEERGIEPDDSLADADREIQREISDVSMQITDAESALARAHRGVSDTQAAIAAGEQRLAEPHAGNRKA